VADILQVIEALAVYALDTLLMPRKRAWNYRRVCLSDGGFDSSQRISIRENCRLCSV
jgi:hypothetical protein